MTLRRWGRIILISAGIALVVAGLAYGLHFGLRPKAVGLIDPSRFRSLDQMGAMAYTRLRQETREASSLFVVTRELNAVASDVVTGFVRAARSDGVELQVVRADLPTALQIAAVEALPKKLFLLARVGVQPLSADPVFSEFLQNHGRKPLVLELVPQPWGERAEASVCARDIRRLDCASAKADKDRKMKKYQPTDLLGQLKRFGLIDYYLFIREPQDHAPDVDVVNENKSAEIDSISP